MEKMICTRYDFWAEKNGMLSPTQYGIRKGTGTRNCLVMLTTDISTSFEIKRQTMAAFLDISGAYDNVSHRCIVWCDARKGAASGNCPIYVEPAVV
jgi:hypothetical protein